ncbi:MAG: hypothetical protein IH831_09485 [Planctomycetes bacterium]|nr:hypothetical protein [Planctomycetota bacterium]
MRLRFRLARCEPTLPSRPVSREAPAERSAGASRLTPDCEPGAGRLTIPLAGAYHRGYHFDLSIRAFSTGG